RDLAAKPGEQAQDAVAVADVEVLVAVPDELPLERLAHGPGAAVGAEEVRPEGVVDPDHVEPAAGEVAGRPAGPPTPRAGAGRAAGAGAERGVGGTGPPRPVRRGGGGPAPGGGGADGGRPARRPRAARPAVPRAGVRARSRRARAARPGDAGGVAGVLELRAR